MVPNSRIVASLFLPEPKLAATVFMGTLKVQRLVSLSGRVADARRTAGDGRRGLDHGQQR